MLKRVAVIGTFALMVAAFAAPARAEVHVGINVGIGAPVYRRVPVRPVVVAPPPVVLAPARVMAPPPYPGYLWQPAHYVYTAYGYQWVPGAWVPARYLAPAPYVARPVVVGPPRGIGVGIAVGRGHAYGRRW
jgi:hypothetical protein